MSRIIGVTVGTPMSINKIKEKINPVTSDDLQNAVETALQEAKDSGAFNGQDGEDGYTPVKGKDYFDGTNGKDGKDATSPVISVSNITGGHRITIKDVNGTKTVDVMDGSNGQNGKDGNGIKSAVLNADYTLTLTFDNGTKYTTPSIRGASGKDGSNGKDGQDGHTPVKGVDYFDGKDGKDGQDGSDGVSATHSWNGTTLTITSASGTSSADLKGATGADGKTPVKGTDYWTDADKTAMVNDVLAALPTWTGGSY